jgi:hypothetical protein
MTHCRREVGDKAMHSESSTVSCGSLWSHEVPWIRALIPQTLVNFLCPGLGSETPGSKNEADMELLPCVPIL